MADHPDRLVARVVRLVDVDSPGGSVATVRLSVLGKEVAAVIVHPGSVQRCRGREVNMARDHRRMPMRTRNGTL